MTNIHKIDLTSIQRVYPLIKSIRVIDGDQTKEQQKLKNEKQSTQFYSTGKNNNNEHDNLLIFFSVFSSSFTHNIKHSIPFHIQFHCIIVTD